MRQRVFLAVVVLACLAAGSLALAQPAPGVPPPPPPAPGAPVGPPGQAGMGMGMMGGGAGMAALMGTPAIWVTDKYIFVVSMGTLSQFDVETLTLIRSTPLPTMRGMGNVGGGRGPGGAGPGGGGRGGRGGGNVGGAPPAANQ